MLFSSSFFAVAAIILYLTLAGWLGVRLMQGRLPHRSGLLLIAAITLMLHLVTLFLSIHSQDSGQNLSIMNIASLASWVITLLITLLYIKKPVQILLPFTYAFAALINLADIFSTHTYLAHIETHPSVLIHISLSLLAYSILTIAALLAILLSVINRQLKEKKRFALNPVMPPLMVVETQIFNLILAGTILLSAALATGLFFLDNFLGSGKAHKAILSAIALAIYVSVLWQHYHQGVRGRWLIIATVTGATLLTLGYFGSRLMREVVLT
ncbi:inner membrane protein YpjD [Corallincola luteus]|uniref:Inner membrane protein YpjD n=1 Tax=Corallincola luteus TaxID=1775177 RepID=A0ABY2APD4_9GAMM|nr:cytochrome c biogenesis protein CcsA [Corallincola luteus]TCI05058.1 inner membrane protein YpjD [Corallincola luteus]